MNIKIQLDAIGVESGVQLDGQDYLGSGVTVLLVRRDPIKVVLISNETNKVLAVCSQGVNDFLVWTSFPVTPNDKPFNKPKGNDNDKVLYEFVKIPKPPISGDEMGDFIEYSTPDSSPMCLYGTAVPSNENTKCTHPATRPRQPSNREAPLPRTRKQLPPWWHTVTTGRLTRQTVRRVQLLLLLQTGAFQGQTLTRKYS